MRSKYRRGNPGAPTGNCSTLGACLNGTRINGSDKQHGPGLFPVEGSIFNPAYAKPGDLNMPEKFDRAGIRCLFENEMMDTEDLDACFAEIDRLRAHLNNLTAACEYACSRMYTDRGCSHESLRA